MKQLIENATNLYREPYDDRRGRRSTKSLKRYRAQAVFQKESQSRRYGRSIIIMRVSSQRGEWNRKNYNMIDGVRNNRRRQVQEQEAQNTEKSAPAKMESVEKEPGKRVSFLQRLREKQAEVAARYGKKAPEQIRDDVSMERNRK